jgi:hypothetical protein
MTIESVTESQFRDVLRRHFTPARPISSTEYLRGRETKLRQIDRAFNSDGKGGRGARRGEAEACPCPGAANQNAGAIARPGACGAVAPARLGDQAARPLVHAMRVA